ncbi:MAG: 30S ribosomal protein S18 [Candidatus Pacebacteria bacterium CG10_big_fil_rev_8_21_14_0_10_42_12]|nr:30S ribosomal protein S18 [Candidatus Paceibacterota bacterium]PIR62243.1 MAG: 30S ribosomal protein S18 [Candidatus Pacebacteria bacterium CG10_big_fil_rev_8_21_14_0_10_42_12]PIY80447.1 MAG: 30S ribosomal protein S18 [Candidatus Pacebacteria bacterium CG_4_10_14_0_8_um_filter_42_14]
MKKPVRRRSTPIMTSFSYKEPRLLEQCLTEQGTILTRLETGLSEKNQRRLAVAIKRARFLAMLPFTQTL